MTSRPTTGPRTAPAPAVRGPAPAYRVLVTSSRTWRDHAAIYTRLDAIHAEHPDMTLMHGAAKEGGDAISDRWAILRGVPVERHPAQWRRYGKAAGYRRNTAMVQTRPDRCEAFIDVCAKPGCTEPMPHGSHGAEHCAHIADLAGIPVHPHRTFTPRPSVEQLALGEAP